jgi:hypothetical protein
VFVCLFTLELEPQHRLVFVPPFYLSDVTVIILSDMTVLSAFCPGFLLPTSLLPVRRDGYHPVRRDGLSGVLMADISLPVRRDGNFLSDVTVLSTFCLGFFRHG